jgi:hypothetical protein
VPFRTRVTAHVTASGDPTHIFSDARDATLAEGNGAFQPGLLGQSETAKGLPVWNLRLADPRLQCLTARRICKCEYKERLPR